MLFTLISLPKVTFPLQKEPLMSCYYHKQYLVWPFRIQIIFSLCKVATGIQCYKTAYSSLKFYLSCLLTIYFSTILSQYETGGKVWWQQCTLNSNKYWTLFVVGCFHILSYCSPRFSICVFNLIAAWIIHQILSRTFSVSVLTNVLLFLMKCIVVAQHFKDNLLFSPICCFSLMASAFLFGLTQTAINLSHNPRE